MRFEAKKGILFQVITYSLTGLIVGIIFYRILKGEALTSVFLLPDLVMLLFLIPLYWALLSTNYELTDKFFLYRSGPLKGKIEIDKIREIVVGKTLWVGLKPALAKKGLIIKYNKYDEIYISPESNESFVQKIREINPGINIIQDKK
ncbi:PH domain-containing protein [Salegentibacter sp. HM20]